MFGNPTEDRVLKPLLGQTNSRADGNEDVEGEGVLRFVDDDDDDDVVDVSVAGLISL